VSVEEPVAEEPAAAAAEPEAEATAAPSEEGAGA
jgi:hypothetical protein